MLGCASLSLSPAAIAPATAPPRPTSRRDPRPRRRRLRPRFLEDDDGGRQDEVRAHDLAAAHVGSRAGLARIRQRALLHQVLHADAALDDDEAIGLLDHHADQADGRLQSVARQLGPAAPWTARPP